MKRYYMIGNTHFDPVWEWKWDESMASIRATFRSALDRMKEDEGFIYSFSCPPVFEWIKNTEPGMFDEIKARVREGRWELCEGWWVQPDCYCAMGESYARHGLYGQRYLKDNFGIFSSGAFNVDSFGHSSSLPQILLKSHILHYCFVRPTPGQYELERPLFVWRGCDGSVIPAYRFDGCYPYELGDRLGKPLADGGDEMILYGVTDHGGAPTKKMISDINAREDAVFSRVDDFFASRGDIGYVVEGELPIPDFGSYSDESWYKRLNRTAEYAALNAEKASVIAGLDRRREIENIWRDIMFGQFHDTLGGTCIKDEYFDARNLTGRAVSSADEITHFSLQSITTRIKTVGENPRDEWNIVAWNLGGAPYRGYIEAEVQWVHQFPWYYDGIELEDADGARYPCQIIPEKSVIPGFRSRFLFKADIPSLGYKCFRVIKTGERQPKPETDISRITTDRFIVSIDRSTGYIASVTDIATGEDLLRGGVRPVCYKDDGDTWCFNISEYGERLEEPELLGVKVTESGIHRIKVKASYRFRSSLIDIYYIIYRDAGYIDVSYRVNWNEKHIVLKLELPVESHGHTAALPYGETARGETKADLPLGLWLDTGRYSVCADSVFAYTMTGGRLNLTVLRSAIYGDLRISPLDEENGDYDYMSQGMNEGKLRIDFGRGRWEMADGFLNPPITIDESNHGGDLPPEKSYYSAEGACLTAVKLCEDGGGTVLRLYGDKGVKTDALLRVEGKEYAVPMRPYEIKTVLIGEGGMTELYITEDSAAN